MRHDVADSDRQPAGGPGEDTGRRDRRILAVIALFYLVGIAGHQLPVTRPLMLLLTPYVLLGCGLAVFLPLARGNRRLLLWSAAVFAVTFILEAAGVATGVVFGSYVYGEVLGLRLLEVPLIIGFNWLLVLIGAVEIARRVVRIPVLPAFAAGGIAVLYDLLLEPVAIRYGYWAWEGVAVPLRNYAAWFLIALAAGLLARAMGVRTRGILAPGYLLIQSIFFLALLLFPGFAA